ncbi:unnamed protein product [Amaranthus hypochondriacus]
MFALIFSAMVTITRAQTKICQKTLSDTCVLATCQQLCFTKYNGHGQCQEKSPGSTGKAGYTCVCNYPCLSTRKINSHHL